MRRAEALAAAAPGRIFAMNKWAFIGMHGLAAAVFIFLLQHFALHASLQSSLLWALTFAGCAAGLAYMQANR